MPIELLTGKPGNAKTAFLVDRMLSEKEKPNPRYIVAMGINGLVDGIADDIIEDPRKWAEITDRTQGPCNCPLVGGQMQDGTYPAHTHRIPSGALICIDEAWKWFGHLQDARGAQTPKHALDLAEHRHMGVDFVWTSQGPNQIFPFVRNLIAEHTHHVRRFGTQFVDTFKWEELQEDVKSEGKRAAALSAVKVIPKRTFGLYKSAQEHTIKTRIPLRVYAIPAVLIVAALSAWLAFQSLRPATAAIPAPKGPDSGLPEPARVAGTDAGRSTQERKPLTPTEYAVLHLPRFATMPHTAPVFDDRSPLSDPLLLCMSSPGGGVDAQGDDRGPSCTCLTEQGTKYEIGQPECRHVARWGQPYNPYRQQGQQPSRDRDTQDGHTGPVARYADVPEVGAGEVGSGARPASYGGMRRTGW